MLRRIREEGSGKRRKLRSVRYRITGFRDPQTGGWITRNPRNGTYYIAKDGRHRTNVRPTQDMIRSTDMIALEVEVDRGAGNSRIYYLSVPGL